MIRIFHWLLLRCCITITRWIRGFTNYLFICFLLLFTRIGPTVKLAYVDQDRPLDPAKSIWEEISGGEANLMRETGGEFPRLRLMVQLQRERPAEKDVGAFRRRAEPGSSGQDVKGRSKRSAFGRADERSRRQHVTGVGRSIREFCRLRRRDLPRPLVFGPRGDAHPGVRGGESCGAGSMGTIPNTRRTESAASATTPRPRIGLNIRS